MLILGLRICKLALNSVGYSFTTYDPSAVIENLKTASTSESSKISESCVIIIICYGRNGEIDMDSLSGGEKVAVALALRLGIAYMMGSSKLDFVILDEPTTHLDEERRKALVKIISEAFREGVGPLAQMIIITHDSEIFEDSEVDAVFRFSMTADGSRVVKE